MICICWPGIRGLPPAAVTEVVAAVVVVVPEESVTCLGCVELVVVVATARGRCTCDWMAVVAVVPPPL